MTGHDPAIDHDRPADGPVVPDFARAWEQRRLGTLLIASDDWLSPFVGGPIRSTFCPLRMEFLWDGQEQAVRGVSPAFPRCPRWTEPARYTFHVLLERVPVLGARPGHRSTVYRAVRHFAGWCGPSFPGPEEPTIGWAEGHAPADPAVRERLLSQFPPLSRTQLEWSDPDPS